MTSARLGTRLDSMAGSLSSRIRKSASYQLLRDRKQERRKNSSSDTSNVQKQDDPIGTAKVTADALNVRADAGSNYARIGGLTKGKSVQYYEEKNGWLRINYGTGFGWINAQFTDYQPPAPKFEEFQARVSGVSALWMRTGPSTDYDQIVALDAGTVVTVIGESNGWYQVKYGDKTGWMSGKYLSKVETGGGGSEAGQKAADYAYTLMNICVSQGWKYDQNKRTSTGYYDCSSFTARCWKEAGVNFNWANSERQAKKIYNAGGEIASASEIQPGDLLFYHHNWNSGTRWRGINHVAIAVGGGKRIDAGKTPVREVGEIGSTVMIGRPTVLM